MRISDWSSDVCSSDLRQHRRRAQLAHGAPRRAEPAEGAAPLLSGHRLGRVGTAAAVARHRRGRLRATDERRAARRPGRSEEHTSELQSLMRISYAVFCLKKKKTTTMQTLCQE